MSSHTQIERQIGNSTNTHVSTSIHTTCINQHTHAHVSIAPGLQFNIRSCCRWDSIHKTLLSSRLSCMIFGWLCQHTRTVSQQLGNEVERQGKANKSTTPRAALLLFKEKKKSYPGWDSNPCMYITQNLALVFARRKITQNLKNVFAAILADRQVFCMCACTCVGSV